MTGGREAAGERGGIFDRDEAPRFEFYQAVRLLEDLHARSAPASAGAAVRFRSRVGLDFPPSDVAAMEPPARPGAPARMTVGVMDLAGVSGPLPRPFAELLVERTFRRDGAFGAFLDLFHDRLVLLLYRVRRKHRLSLSPRRPHRALLARPLFALLGLGTPRMRGRMRRERVRDPALLGFAGLLAQRPRSMAGLLCLLGAYFRVPVRGAAFRGRWHAVEREDHTHIGASGRNRALGRDTVLGRRVWDQQAGFEVTVGPLPLARFLDFLPIGRAYRPFRELTRFYVGHEPDFSACLVLRGGDVPRSRLGSADDGEGGARLGWTSWLRTRGEAGPDEVVRLGEAAWRDPPLPGSAMTTVTEKLQDLNDTGIRELLGKFEVLVRGGTSTAWKFPAATGGDGCVGALCVSRCHTEVVAGAAEKLAVHVTFEIPQIVIASATTVRRDAKVAVKVKVRNLHFTARPVSSQDLISSVGASSILQAQVSTHRGRSNDWKHRGSDTCLVALATALGLGTSTDHARAQAKDAIDQALAAYDGTELARLGPLVTWIVGELVKERLKLPKEFARFPVDAAVTTENW